MTNRYKADTVLKKVFSSNKNTMLHDIRRSVDNLPIINTAGQSSSGKSKNNSYTMINA